MSGDRAAARAVLEVGDLLHEIRLGQVRDVRVLGLAPAGRQMAVAARPHLRLASLADDWRHRRVIFRMPVGRREEVADLRQRQLTLLFGHALRHALIGRRDVVRQIRPDTPSTAAGSRRR